MKTSMTKPIPETTPRPMPPYREPIYSITSKNRNSRYNMFNFLIRNRDFYCFGIEGKNT
jgi:hypothetical protein